MNEIWIVRQDHLDCEGKYSTGTDNYYFDNETLANICYEDLKKNRWSYVFKPKKEIINKNWSEHGTSVS